MAKQVHSHREYTRQDSLCPVYGKPSQLERSCLPTFGDVMRAVNWERFNRKTTRQEPKWTDVSKCIATHLEEIWSTASIPTVSTKRILDMLTAYYHKFKNIMKPYKGRSHDQKYQEKLTKFRDESKNLFDIAACKCFGGDCNCPAIKKVPKREIEFLNDQRNERKMRIGPIDVTTTQSIRKAEERREKRSNQPSTSGNITRVHPQPSTSGIGHPHQLLESSSSDESTDDSDFERHLQTRCTKRQGTRQQKITEKLPSLALTCDRYGVSDRVGASIASAVLKDTKIITEENTEEVIDRSKIRRERKKTRTQVTEDKESAVNKSPICIFFDGKKDKTLYQMQKGNKKHKQEIVEEHITLLEEPGSKYICHLSPTKGSGDKIAEIILSQLKEKSISLRNLQAVGCDGTAVNTGHKKGVISILEQELEKPLQWLICQLHANELPLRHLIIKLDGPTTGPKGFTGSICRQLSKCEELPLIDFEPVECEDIDCDPSILSTDQKYLLEACRAVSTGECGESLQHRDPGNISHSRWLTTANRLLRLYMSTETPSDNFLLIVQFIMKVYIPMWFKIKAKSSITHGSLHLFDTICRVRQLEERVQEIVFPVLQRNAFYGHAEALLLAMVHSEDKMTRILGYRRILKARSIDTRENLRALTLPKLNFEAKSFTDMINWQTAQLTDPPLLKHITNDELNNFIQSGDVPCTHAAEIPCHSQNVERMIKLVTESCLKVCGSSNREGWILSALISRQAMPSFDTKKQFATPCK